MTDATSEIVAELHAYLNRCFANRLAEGAMAMDVRRAAANWLFNRFGNTGDSPFHDDFGAIPWADLEPWATHPERRVTDREGRLSEPYQDRSRLMIAFRRRRLMEIVVAP